MKNYYIFIVMAVASLLLAGCATTDQSRKVSLDEPSVQDKYVKITTPGGVDRWVLNPLVKVSLAEVGNGVTTEGDDKKTEIKFSKK